MTASLGPPSRLVETSEQLRVRAATSSTSYSAQCRARLVMEAADDVRKRLVLERFEPPPREAEAPRVAGHCSTGVMAKSSRRAPRGCRRTAQASFSSAGSLLSRRSRHSSSRRAWAGDRSPSTQGARPRADRQPLAQIQVRGAQRRRREPPGPRARPGPRPWPCRESRARRAP